MSRHWVTGWQRFWTKSFFHLQESKRPWSRDHYVISKGLDLVTQRRGITSPQQQCCNSQDLPICKDFVGNVCDLLCTHVGLTQWNCLTALMVRRPWHVNTRVGTLIVATIYLQLIQNRYMFRSFTVLHCSHQHCVQSVASDLEVVGYL